MKRNPLNEALVSIAVKSWNANCKTCKYLQRYTHPMQELHYHNVKIIGECKMMKVLVYDNDKPRCKGILYEDDFEMEDRYGS